MFEIICDKLDSRLLKEVGNLVQDGVNIFKISFVWVSFKQSESADYKLKVDFIGISITNSVPLSDTELQYNFP